MKRFGNAIYPTYRTKHGTLDYTFSNCGTCTLQYQWPVYLTNRIITIHYTTNVKDNRTSTYRTMSMLSLIIKWHKL